MKQFNWIRLIFLIVLCELTGFIGAQFTFSALPVWYAGLLKPWFTPPGWIFGPIWTILYLLMGISLYLIWQKGIKKKEVKAAAELFLLQLILNAGWSILFFGLHNLLAAFIEIIFLWFLIIETTFAFYKLDKLAAKLLLPYLAWVSFAAVLSYYIWVLNR